jgi:hypothetical protein
MSTIGSPKDTPTEIAQAIILGWEWLLVSDTIYPSTARRRWCCGVEAVQWHKLKEHHRALYVFGDTPAPLPVHRGCMRAAPTARQAINFTLGQAKATQKVTDRITEEHAK